MDGLFLTVLTKFIQFNLFLNRLFVFSGPVVDIFTILASQFD